MTTEIDPDYAAADEADDSDLYEVDDNGYITVQQWLCIDAEGAYETGCDEGEALSRYDDNITGNGTRRLVCVENRVRVPRPVKVSVHVPDEAGTTVETTVGDKASGE